MAAEVTGVDGAREAELVRAAARPAQGPPDARREARPASVTSGNAPSRPGFLRRHALPLVLAVIALCLYAGSILYILLGRGQIA